MFFGVGLEVANLLGKLLKIVLVIRILLLQLYIDWSDK